MTEQKGNGTLKMVRSRSSRYRKQAREDMFSDHPLYTPLRLDRRACMAKKDFNKVKDDLFTCRTNLLKHEAPLGWRRQADENRGRVIIREMDGVTPLKRKTGVVGWVRHVQVLGSSSTVSLHIPDIGPRLLSSKSQTGIETEERVYWIQQQMHRQANLNKLSKMPFPEQDYQNLKRPANFAKLLNRSLRRIHKAGYWIEIYVSGVNISNSFPAFPRIDKLPDGDTKFLIKKISQEKNEFGNINTFTLESIKKKNQFGEISDPSQTIQLQTDGTYRDDSDSDEEASKDDLKSTHVGLHPESQSVLISGIPEHMRDDDALFDLPAFEVGADWESRYSAVKLDGWSGLWENEEWRLDEAKKVGWDLSEKEVVVQEVIKEDVQEDIESVESEGDESDGRGQEEVQEVDELEPEPEPEPEVQSVKNSKSTSKGRISKSKSKSKSKAKSRPKSKSKGQSGKENMTIPAETPQKTQSVPQDPLDTDEMQVDSVQSEARDESMQNPIDLVETNNAHTNTEQNGDMQVAGQESLAQVPIQPGQHKNRDQLSSDMGWIQSWKHWTNTSMGYLSRLHRIQDAHLLARKVNPKLKGNYKRWAIEAHEEQLFLFSADEDDDWTVLYDPRAKQEEPPVTDPTPSPAKEIIKPKPAPVICPSSPDYSDWDDGFDSGAWSG